MLKGLRWGLRAKDGERGSERVPGAGFSGRAVGPSHFGNGWSLRECFTTLVSKSSNWEGQLWVAGKREHSKTSLVQRISLPRPDDPVAWTFRRGLRDTVHLPSPRYFLSLLPHTCSMCPHPGAEEADLERRVTNLQTHACDTLLGTHTDPPNGHTATSPSHRHRCIPRHRHRHAQAQIWKHMGR